MYISTNMSKHKRLVLLILFLLVAVSILAVKLITKDVQSTTPDVQNWALRELPEVATPKLVNDNVLHHSSSSLKSIVIDNVGNWKLSSEEVYSYYDFTDEELIEKIHLYKLAPSNISEIIKSYTLYTLNNSAYEVDITVNEYSTSTPYVALWNLTYYEGKAPEILNLVDVEKKYRISNEVSFVSNGIPWRCFPAPPQGYWSVYYRCDATYSGFDIHTTVTYTPDPTDLGLTEEDYSDLDIDHFYKLTKELQDFKNRQEDFHNLIKSIRIDHPY